MKKLEEVINSNMKWKYLALLFRFLLLVVVTVLFFSNSNLIEYPTSFFERLLPMHFIWLFFFIFFVIRMVGKKGGIIASNRKYAKYNDIVPNYDEEKLEKFIKRNNKRVPWIILLALIYNVPLWVMYGKGIIDERFLFLAFILLFFLDMVCETLYCPFQRIFLKGRCCHVCRIYSWDSFLAVTPLLAVAGFFSMSLIFIAFIDMAYYEIQLYRHPEYFWDGSNAALRCVNCKKKMCVVRGKVTTLG